MRKLALSDEILLSVQQPARYIGGEVNSVVKDPSRVDVYEIYIENRKKHMIL